MPDTKKFNRRTFLKSAAVASAFTIVPRNALGGRGIIAPSEKLNIAGIGVGGKGFGDLMNMQSENIVALCEIDDRRAGRAYKQWPKAKVYRDFRKMLTEQKDIDAVTIATPDHLHYVISMWALKHGKHVYCQKPMTHTISEARSLAKEAAKSNLATQMGNQGNADEGVRLIQEYIEDDAIGTVSEVHCWTNKPVWPQGIDRYKETHPIPKELDWDLWLGPAKHRPFHHAYAPFLWRGWWDFGSCSLGDMGCHVLNNPWRALDLGLPESVEAYSTKCKKESGPLASIVYYNFPARGPKPSVKLTWYDGGNMPPRPVELETGRRMGDNEGCLFIGDKGKIVCDCYGGSPRIIPESKMREFGRPTRRIERSPGHYAEWINACKGGPKPGSHFEHAALLTEVVHLGNVAIRSATHQKQNGRDVKILWDAKEGKVTNVPHANQYLHTEPRKGWEI
jgi:predicted dehydrogenase